MTSEIRTNSLKSRAGLSTVTLTDSGPIFSGITTFLDNSIFNVGNINATGIVTARSGIRVTADGSTSVNYISVGASNDFKLYHTGSHTHLDNDTGHITLTANQINLNNQDNSENCLQCVGNAEVRLFYNGVKKFETGSGGVVVTGQMYSNSAEIRGAAGGDAVLNLFSDAGSQNADKVRLRQTHVGNSFLLESYASGAYQSILKGTDTRSVELHYQGSKKFETTTNGAEITGQLDITGGFVSLDDNYSVVMGTGGDAQLYHSGSHQYLLNTTGNTYFMPKASETGIAIIPDGAVELYHDNSKKFETHSGGTKTIGYHQIDSYSGTSGHGRLDFGNSGTPFIRAWDTGNHGSGSKLEIVSGDGDDQITCIRNGAVNLFYDGSKKFETTSLGTQIFGDAQFEGNNGTDNQLKWDKSDDSLYFRDGVKAQFGTGGDLQLYHTAGDSYIRNTGGFLSFGCTNNADLKIVTNNTERMRITNGGDAVFGGGINVGVDEPFFVETGGTIRRRYQTNNGSGIHFTGGSLMPTTGTGAFTNGGTNLGTGSHRWGQIYSTSSSISTSDRTLKNTIQSSDLGLEFIKKLNPVSYKFNDGKSGRTHYGLISQDVETVLTSLGKTGVDFGGFCKDKNIRVETKPDENGGMIDVRIDEEGDTYSLRYEEFIGPLVKAVQDLAEENIALRARVTNLEGN
tara:strand:- start:20 stop:2071 length:2052 start_codon:yes stop_codon:yes gene_type:complete